MSLITLSREEKDALINLQRQLLELFDKGKKISSDHPLFQQYNTSKSSLATLKDKLNGYDFVKEQMEQEEEDRVDFKKAMDADFNLFKQELSDGIDKVNKLLEYLGEENPLQEHIEYFKQY